MVRILKSFQIEGYEKDTKAADLAILNIFTSNFDGFVKSQKTPFLVIPAKAGIQFFQLVTEFLDSGACPGHRSGVHRSDDFSRIHQF